jgi:Ca2+-binding RTX toxin-like protein
VSTKNIFFIDSRVAGYETLIAGLSADTEWYLLDANEDGVDQMQRILAGYSDLDSVQVISHGSAGTLYLGSTVLNGDNLTSYQTQLQAIGSSLTETGDILLYGCNVAQGDVGVSFVNSLAQITRADVAASDGVTGLGGNWLLEQASGQIETTTFYSADYQSTLATLTGGEGNDTITGTSSADTINARGGNDIVYGMAGNDTILGGTGQDSIYGGLGDDRIVSDGWNSFIDGEDGNDTIVGHGYLYGGSGDDSFGAVQGFGLVQGNIFGGSGNDRVFAGVYYNNNLIDGGEGNDYLHAEVTWSNLANPKIIGGSGDDAIILGTDMGPFVDDFSLTYRPEIDGGADFDILTLRYFEGATSSIDLLDSWDMSGIKNIEQIAIYGGIYSNYLRTLKIENDTVPTGETLIVSLDSTSDLSISLHGLRVDASNVIDGHLYISSVAERLGTFSSGDYIIGGQLADTIVGGSDNHSKYFGEGGNDLIRGGISNDEIRGGSGDDTLDGGDGVDFALYQGARSSYTISEITYNTFSVSDNSGVDGVDTIIDINYIRFTDQLFQIVIRGMNIVGDETNEEFSGGSESDRLDGAGGADTLNGGGGNDLILGGTGNDSLYGADGNDSVDGGDGNDLIVGGDGAGNDTYVGGSGTDTVKYTSATAKITANLATGSATGTNIGTDVLSQIESIIGGQIGDSIVGSSGANVIDGYTGADTMVGGLGNDTYYVDNSGDVVTESSDTVSGGVDTIISTVTRTLGNYQEKLTLSGAAAINGTGNTLANSLTGNGANNVLKGGDGNDTLTGGAGADTLQGDLGADSLVGGTGNDTYVVNLKSTGGLEDLIVETSTVTTEIDTLQLAGASTNTSAVNISLAASSLLNVEHLNASSTGSSLLSLTGNALANSLTGNSANNIINGGSGTDTLVGGAGDDTYYVDVAGDVITETSTGGKDLVLSSLLGTYVMGNYVEEGRINTSGTANLTGNSLSNILYAGAGNNILNGGAGTEADTVSYQYGLVSGATLGVTVSLLLTGAQTTGRSGSDTLTNIENLTGSSLNDTLIGSAGNNVLDGGSGSDSLVGGLGNDTYVINTSADIIVENASEGTDTVNVLFSGYTLGTNLENGRISTTATANLTGNSLSNFLYAGKGNNVINGGTGTDSVSFYEGNNGTGVTASLVTGTATGGSGTDTLISIERLYGTNYADKLTGDTGANYLRGYAGNDILDGGTGIDSMVGDDGNDIYYVRDVGDVVSETNAATAGGIDTVYSYLTHSSTQTYTLGTNVENGRIVATTASNMTGNSLSNTIYAGAGNNLISGGTGTEIDTVSYQYGLLSSATTGVNANLATGAVTGGSGADTLTRIEHLIGSNLNDTLVGSAGNNSLNGGSGNDSISGGDGNDTLIGGAGKDTLVGGNGNDIFDFNALSEMGLTSTTWDVISGFVSGQDRIDLSTLDANTATTTNDVFDSLTVGGTFSGSFASAGDLYFDNVARVLYGNTDGDVAAEFAIQITGVTTLATSDFIL